MHITKFSESVFMLLLCLGTLMIPVGLIGAMCGHLWNTLSTWEQAEAMLNAPQLASVYSWFALHTGSSLIAAIAGGTCLLAMQIAVWLPIDPPPELRQAIRTHTVV